MAQHTGKVGWYNNTKGFGFLTPTSGPNVFAHYSSIQSEGYKSLREGDPVTFDIVIGSSGRPQADNVQLVNTIGEAS